MQIILTCDLVFYKLLFESVELQPVPMQKEMSKNEKSTKDSSDDRKDQFLNLDREHVGSDCFIGDSQV